jgi:acetyl-CoA carboxylase beta subunit
MGLPILKPKIRLKKCKQCKIWFTKLPESHYLHVCPKCITRIRKEAEQKRQVAYDKTRTRKVCKKALRKS